MADLDVFERQGFGKPLGYGTKTALLIIDFQICFLDEDGLGGFNLKQAIDNTAELLPAVRAAGMPVAHVRFVAPGTPGGIGTFAEKVPVLNDLTRDHPGAPFVPSVAPIAGEYVMEKEHASAFFGTSFSTWLRTSAIDTLLIAGCTTSGCVRASVVDASAYGMRPIVVEDCVGDRAKAPHDASLFDMHQKYADIKSLGEVLGDLKQGLAA